MLNLEPNYITLWLNIIFYIFLFLIAVFAVVGAIKGVWKTVVSMVIQGLLLLIVALISPGVATLVGNIDLSKWVGTQTTNLFGTPVQVGSIRGMVCEYITATGVVSPVTGQSIYEVAMALTNILISFVVFLILAILFGLFGWLLSALIYHTIVKWFVPKRIRMGHKFRWLGALSGAIMGFFVSWLMISPFSYVLNTVRQNKEALTAAKKSLNDQEDMYVDYLLAASDSTLASDYLYGMSSPVVNMSTTSSVLGTKADISTLTSLIAGLGKGFAKGLDSSNNSPLDYTLIVGNQAAVDMMLDTLIKNNLVVTTLPFLLDAAVAYVQTPEQINLTKLNFHDVDYSNELTSVKGIYNQLFQAGFITKALTDKDYTIDLAHEDQYMEALRIFAEDPLIENNLAVLGEESAKIIRNMTGYEILNTDSAVYKPFDGKEGVDWSKEILTLGKAMFSLSSTLGVPFTLEGAMSLKDKMWQAMSNPDQFSSIRTILVGGNGNDGLFDSFIFDENIMNIDQSISAIFAYYPLLDNFVNKNNVIDVFSGAKRADIKNELVTLTDMFPLIKNIADVAYVKDTDSFNWDLTNPKIIDGTKQLVEKAKNFTLLKSLIPDAIYRSFPYLLKNTFGSSSIFGLNVGSFDFSSADEVLDGMTQFLDVVPSMVRIYDITKENNGFKDIIEKIDSNDFKQVMDVFIDSSMLNPDKTILVDGKTQNVENYNINTLIKGLFGQFKLDSYGIDYPNDLSSISWKVTNSDGRVTHPEVDKLVKLFEDFKKTADVLENDGKVNMNNMSGDAFKSLLNDMVDSDLLGDSTNNFLNKQLKPVWDGIGIEINFNKSRKEWQDKDKHQMSSIDYIGQLFDLVKPIWEHKNFDYNNVTKEYLNAVLTTFYNGKFLSGSGTSLDYFLGDILDKSFDLSSLTGYDGKQLFSNPNEENFAWVNNDKLISDSFNIYKEGSVGEGEDNPSFKNVYFDQNGEIKKISDAFSVLSGFKDNVNDGNFSGDDLKTALLALHPSKTLSKLISPLIRKALNNVSTSQTDLLDKYGIDLSLLDTDTFAALPEGEFASELDKLVTLYSYSKDGVIQDILGNLDKLNETSKVTGKTRLQVLDEILRDIDSMKITSSTRLGKDNSFRVNFYASLFENVKLVIGGNEYTLNQIVFLNSANSRSLMVMRAKDKEQKDGVLLNEAERKVILDFMLNQKTYIANRNYSKLAELEEIGLLKGAADNLISLILP